MITREQFCAFIEAMKQQNDYDNHIAGLLTEAHGFADIMCYDNHRLTNVILTFLQQVFQQEKHQCMIEFYLYELDYGRKYREGVYLVNKQPVDISTPSALYDELLRQLPVQVIKEEGVTAIYQNIHNAYDYVIE
jgi:hypothetical protein